MFCCFHHPAVLEEMGTEDNSSKMFVGKDKLGKAAANVALIMVCDEISIDGSEAANAAQGRAPLPATNTSPLLRAWLVKSAAHRAPAAGYTAKVAVRQHSADASTPVSRPAPPARAAPVHVIGSHHTPAHHSAFSGQPTKDAKKDQAKQQGGQEEEEEDAFEDACEEFVAEDDSTGNNNDQEYVDACEHFAPVAACTMTASHHPSCCGSCGCQGPDWAHAAAVGRVCAASAEAAAAQVQAQQQQSGAQEEGEITSDQVPWWRGLSTAEILCVLAPKHMADLGRRSTAEILSVIAPSRVAAAAASSWRRLNVITERPTQDSASDGCECQLA